MKAYTIIGKESGKVVDIAVPEIRDDEVLIRIKASGLCGTDVHIYQGEYFSAFPIIPGHEFAGEVVNIGKKVKYFKPGDRVAADPNIFCEKCSYCKENKQNFCLDFQAAGVTRDGGFAEFVAIPEANCFDIADIPYEQAALLEPLACVVHGHELAKGRTKKRVLVFGVGAIGLMHVQMCRLLGAAEICAVDLRTERLKLAVQLGADRTFLSTPGIYDELLAEYETGFDMVIDTTGIPAVIEKEFRLVGPTGTFFLFGVAPAHSSFALNPYEVFRKEITILGSFALKKTLGTAVDLVKNKRIALAPLIGDQIALEQLDDYIGRMLRGETELKTQVVFGDDETHK